MGTAERDARLKEIKKDIESVEISASYWFNECAEAQKRNDNAALESAKRHYQMRSTEAKAMRSMMNRMMELL